MQVQTLDVSKEAARNALIEYKQHRNVYDQRDWEIERIYRAIAKGNTVISVTESIRQAGLDEKNRPRLAICEAHAAECIADSAGDHFTFGLWNSRSFRGTGKITVPWPRCGYTRALAKLPRIPPQHRPAEGTLSNYHLLWEADWEDIPVDPMLLKRIGKDAWVVLAAWNLTSVEMNVLRSRRV